MYAKSVIFLGNSKMGNTMSLRLAIEEYFYSTPIVRRDAVQKQNRFYFE